MANITLDPITRIEGHLGITLSSTGATEATVATVTNVESAGTMFRGFELILKDRNPRDAIILTSRICGV